MQDLFEQLRLQTRRDFLRKTTNGLGALALGSLLGPQLFGRSDGLIPSTAGAIAPGGVLPGLHHAPKAKRVIYLFQYGGPSQIELFDYKPELIRRWGEEIPDSVRGNQRLSGMLTSQATFPLVGSKFNFSQHGANGTWISDLLPHTSQIVDDICLIKSMHTEAINQEPALIFFQSGSQQTGRPSVGSWFSYGLGSPNQNLPAYVVMLSKGRDDVQNLNKNAWSNGFLPSHHQGVQFRSGRDPVLYINNPDGIDRDARRRELDYLTQLEAEQKAQWGDPEIDSKLNQYEMAYRMQASVPEVTDLSDEPDYIFDMYGPDSRIPGTFAANCLLARRLAERDVRFVQLFHMGWDQHGGLPREIQRMTQSADQASAALVKDLKQRGLLDDTLVVWGGEFGRTSFSQGRLTRENYGRDHHPRCFSLWMAGGGVRPGIQYGQTDDFSYNIVKDPVHVHDFQATLLHLLGVDHERLTFKHQGRRYRLTDVSGEVVKGILA